ncbi:hypothetical protein PPTG_10739 [Phytophthora nicotianae INRA-310]|nr:hypothetical protein PPTG_10739 [Phytophthora nicotianae INRA-310]ETN09951.1 hypothetical protein PPTG_10739 [Phytophthora nicotianae INRA-310]
MVYLEKVNRTIRAMKDAVQEHRQQKQAEQKQTEEKQQEEPVEDEADDCLEVVETECKTFAEFGLESRILEASNVEWAFSAMY